MASTNNDSFSAIDLSIDDLFTDFLEESVWNELLEQVDNNEDGVQPEASVTKASSSKISDLDKTPVAPDVPVTPESSASTFSSDVVVLSSSTSDSAMTCKKLPVEAIDLVSVDGESSCQLSKLSSDTTVTEVQGADSQLDGVDVTKTVPHITKFVYDAGITQEGPFSLDMFRDVHTGEWKNFTKIENPSSLEVQAPCDLNGVRLQLWSDYGWIDGFHFAPCILNSPKTVYIWKPSYTAKELRKLNCIAGRKSFLTPLLAYQCRKGTAALNNEKNKFFSPIGSKPLAALLGKMRFECSLFHHPFLGVSLAITEPNLLLIVGTEGVKLAEYMGIVSSEPSANNEYRARINERLVIDAESFGNWSRFINSCEKPEDANCKLVVERDLDFYNIAVYLTKDIDTAAGPVFLYFYYDANFHLVEAEDVAVP
ncbi:hypothetical protein CYMTET_49700 [Cymbomonas tetramitiformis]|uniref:SET domain-containing protein n=1 Tax=Cymbomonas tetramitiformis TaxID=36881 RepID=A0AAE0ETV9_9CHLO|nr:hypothetical protein CYMTET_49700 [Cymbomonas tetramitiformis]